MAGPDMPGDTPLSTSARVAALDCLLDDIGTHLNRIEADFLIDYVAYRYERGEIEGARNSLRSMAGVDLTAVYRIEAVLHTDVWSDQHA